MAKGKIAKESGMESFQRKLYVPALVFGVLGILIVSVMPWIGEVSMAAPGVKTTIGRWVAFLGEFHPLFLHLPIGALMLVFLMEAGGIVTGGRYKPNTTLGLFFAGATSIFAVVFGYCLYLTGEFSGVTIEAHKRDGIIFSVLVLASFMLKYTVDLRGGIKVLKPIYLVVMAGSGVVMMMAGHHGGEITHGDPLDKAPWMIEDEEEKDPAELADPVVYKDIVHPILVAKCITCHKESKKKGGLRMDTYAFLKEGGNEVDCLVPGDVKGSAMITYLHKPLEDDLHMPPKDKTQLTEEEKQILEWWVKIGAPETAKQSEVEVTPQIAKALESLLTPEEIAAIAKAKEEAEAKKASANKAKREALALGLETVNEKYAGSLNYVSQENTDLRFSVVSYRDKFGDDNMEVVKLVAGDVAELDLAGSAVTDKGLAALASFTNVRSLKLSNTGVTDESLPVIAKLGKLEILNLYGTAVSDEGIKALHGKSGLMKVYLWNSKVTEAGAKELEESLREVHAKAQEALPEDERSGVVPEVLLGM